MWHTFKCIHTLIPNCFPVGLCSNTSAAYLVFSASFVIFDTISCLLSSTQVKIKIGL